MTFWHYLIVLVPLAFVLGMAVYCRRYVRDVVDFLAAGRLAGRYVLSVAGMESALGVIVLVSLVEVKYRTGFALEFWNLIMTPLGIMLALTGFCVYRYRQTKALSLGQFLETRYSRSFRILALSLRTIAEMLTNTIGPALSARFLIYLLDWPPTFIFLGVEWGTFSTVMALSLALALFVIFCGGMVALVVTDCIQGLFCYPMFIVFTVYVLVTFSWSGEIVPVMFDRAPGESFLDPFDISHLRDFNLFALVVMVVAAILNRGIWLGGGTSGAARNAHEQKMAGVLGTWRGGFSTIMILLLGVAMITVLTHQNYSAEARGIRQDLSRKIADELVSDAAQRGELVEAVAALPETRHQIGVDAPPSQAANPDTPYMDAALATFDRHHGEETGRGKAQFQQFRSLFSQMMLPVTLRHIFPPVLLALFCLFLLLLMLSTDDSKMFSSALTIAQDIVLPLRGRSLPVDRQLWLIRFSALGVAVVFFLGSSYLAQLDYVQLYSTIMVSIWAGGAGPVMVFGLYSRFGTTCGAYASLLAGSGISIGGALLQRNWAEVVYPFLARREWVDGAGELLAGISAPFGPYIVWEMNPVKCPVNSYEFFFLAMVGGTLAYVAASLATRKQPFNLDRMLYRGAYREEAEVVHAEKVSLLNRLVGVSKEYTRGDKMIAWSVFFMSVVWNFLIAFVLVLVWNLFSPWPREWWSHYFLVTMLVVPGVLAAVTTIWFFVGGVIDLRRLFRDLARRTRDAADNGTVDKGGEEE